MKENAIVITRNRIWLHYGATVDVLKKFGTFYWVKAHGSRKIGYLLSREEFAFCDEVSRATFYEKQSVLFIP